MPNQPQTKTVPAIVALLLLLVTLFLPSSSFGAALVSSLTYSFDHTLSGVAPAGPTPWLTATFNNAGPDTVQLTLSAIGLTGNESVSGWYFNLNPLLNPGSLSFSEIGSSGSFAAPNVSVGANAFKPAGDGKYDLMIDFGLSGDNVSSFSGGDSVIFNITGIAGLTASDFLFANTPSAGHDPLLTAANLQTVGETVVFDTPPSVPDTASTSLLLGLAVFALEGARRRLRSL